MFGPFTDVMPKAFVAGAVLWGGVSYFVTGPSIAARLALFDHVPVCERSHQAMVQAGRERRRRELEAERFDPSREITAEILRQFGHSKFVRELDTLGGGLMGRTIDQTLRQHEHGKQAADDARRDLDRRTATDLAAGGSVCGCIADAAIAETRTEWAIYAGTLSLVHPGPVVNFGQRMTELHGSGRCAAQRAAG